MKIGIDLSFIRPDHKNGGTESALKNLIRGIESIRQQPKYKDLEFVFFIHQDIYEDYRLLFPDLNYRIYHTKGSHPVRMIWFQTFVLPGLVKKEHLDLMYFPTFQTGLKKKWNIPLIINPNDIQYKYYPEYFSKAKRIYYNIFYRNSLKKATVLIAISNYVKQSYEEFFKKEIGNKMRVIYAPIDFSGMQDEESEQDDIMQHESHNMMDGQDYILCINSLTKHKNLITLIKAFDLLQSEKLKLVIGGARWNGTNELQEYIESHQLKDKIILTGRLTDGQLQYLYRHARLFVTTSLYEGFGMTPIEAMAAECPVISSKETSLYEVTMGSVNYYEPATDAQQLANRMQDVLQQIDAGQITKTQLEKLHHEVAARYDKAEIAGQYLDLFLQFCDNQ